MNFILNHFTEIVNIFTYIVTTASLITKLTPSKKDDEVVGKVKKSIEFLALIPKEK